MATEQYTFDWPDTGRCHCLEVNAAIQHAFLVGEETDLEKVLLYASFLTDRLLLTF